MAPFGNGFRNNFNRSVFESDVTQHGIPLFSGDIARYEDWKRIIRELFYATKEIDRGTMGARVLHSLRGSARKKVENLSPEEQAIESPKDGGMENIFKELDKHYRHSDESAIFYAIETFFGFRPRGQRENITTYLSDWETAMGDFHRVINKEITRDAEKEWKRKCKEVSCMLKGSCLPTYLFQNRGRNYIQYYLTQ